MNGILSPSSQEEEPVRIEKTLLSVLLTNLPPGITKHYLAELLRNEDIVLGVQILPNNEAEIVVSSVYEI